MANVRVLSLTILLASIVLASSLLNGAFAQAGYGSIDPFKVGKNLEFKFYTFYIF